MRQRSVFCGLLVDGLEGYIHLNEFFSVVGHIVQIRLFFVRADFTLPLTCVAIRLAFVRRPQWLAPS